MLNTLNMIWILLILAILLLVIGVIYAAHKQG